MERQSERASMAIVGTFWNFLARVTESPVPLKPRLGSTGARSTCFLGTLPPTAKGAPQPPTLLLQIPKEHQPFRSDELWLARRAQPRGAAGPPLTGQPQGGLPAQGFSAARVTAERPLALAPRSLPRPGGVRLE